MFIKFMYKKCIISLLSAVIFLNAPVAYASDVCISIAGEPLGDRAEVRDGITYVPLVPLLSALGDWETEWDSRSRTATAETELFTLSVPIGKDHVTADGFLYGLTGDCVIIHDRTYVPLRSLANLFGAEVTFTDWNSPITVTPGQTVPHSQEDLYWLSRVISAESRGESLYGQIAVGNVVLNRLRDPAFPDTIRGVVFDTKNAVQFEPTANGTIYHDPTAQSILAARLVLNGADAVGECLYFFNPSLSQGTWIREHRPYHTTIGCHRFYL